MPSSKWLYKAEGVLVYIIIFLTAVLLPLFIVGGCGGWAGIRRVGSYALSWKPCQGDSLNLPDHRAQVDQGSQIKMIQVKEMMQDNDLKNSKSKDKGSKSRSQSMDEQSHYKQDKTITRQSINVKRHIFNVIGGTEEFEERDLNIGGDC
ncbi:hypothetical protein Tco_1516292 [Tanacetum coccineum]